MLQSAEPDSGVRGVVVVRHRGLLVRVVLRLLRVHTWRLGRTRCLGSRPQGGTERGRVSRVGCLGCSDRGDDWGDNGCHGWGRNGSAGGAGNRCACNRCACNRCASSAPTTAGSAAGGATAVGAGTGGHRRSRGCPNRTAGDARLLSLIHISEPTRRTPISYAVFCLKKKTS